MSTPSHATTATKPWCWLSAALLATAVTVGASACTSSADGPALDAKATVGQQVAKDKGCTNCHTANGNRSEGPTWKGIYGQPVQLTDGTTVTVDDAYIARSITDPSAQVVAGFQPLMPKTGLTDAEIVSVTDYIKALR